MEENIRVRYSDKELEEFKAIIEEKIKKGSDRLRTYPQFVYEQRY